MVHPDPDLGAGDRAVELVGRWLATRPEYAELLARRDARHPGTHAGSFQVARVPAPPDPPASQGACDGLEGPSEEERPAGRSTRGVRSARKSPPSAGRRRREPSGPGHRRRQRAAGRPSRVLTLASCLCVLAATACVGSPLVGGPAGLLG